MPFTHDQFLDVFARYNRALWPVVVALWVVSALAFGRLLRTGGAAARPLSALLAFHWAWSGVAYHLAFFAAINPVARVFALLFLLQAAFLAWLAARGRLRFSNSPTPWHVVGFAFIAYGLLYPAIAFVTGQVFPRAPTFGVPCPTTLFTAGFLLTLDPPFPRAVVVVPILWALVGGTGAFLLHVPADWALFAAALALAAHAARRAAARKPAAAGAGN